MGSLLKPRKYPRKLFRVSMELDQSCRFHHKPFLALIYDYQETSQEELIASLSRYISCVYVTDYTCLVYAETWFQFSINFNLCFSSRSLRINISSAVRGSLHREIWNKCTICRRVSSFLFHVISQSANSPEASSTWFIRWVLCEVQLQASIYWNQYYFVTKIVTIL